MLLGVVSVIEQLMKGSVCPQSGFLEQLLSKTELLKRVFLRTFAAVCRAGRAGNNGRSGE